METLSLCSWKPTVFPIRIAAKAHSGYKFTVKACSGRTGEDADAPLSSTSTAFAVLGVLPNCSAAELKDAFRAKVHSFLLFL